MQIAQDDDGNFEFTDIGGISDDEDDPETKAQKKLEEGSVQPGGSASTSFTDQAFAPSARGTTSRTAPQRPRESLDGETIFAVGEHDDWSDADDSDTEHGRLTRKIQMSIDV